MSMCGRYYLNGETVREIGELLALWNRRAGGKDCSNTGWETSDWEKERGLWKKRGRETLKAAAEAGRKAHMEAGEEFCPGRTAPVLVWNGEEFAVEEKRWGFSGREKNRLLFNARAETAMEKPSFRGCMEARRCLALASCFMSGIRRESVLPLRDLRERAFFWPDATRPVRREMSLSS